MDNNFDLYFVGIPFIDKAIRVLNVLFLSIFQNHLGIFHHVLRVKKAELALQELVGAGHFRPTVTSVIEDDNVEA